MSKVTLEDVKQACMDLWGMVPREVDNWANSDELYCLLEHLTIEHAAELVEWSNQRRLSLEDVVQLCSVTVEQLIRDGFIEAKCCDVN